MRISALYEELGDERGSEIDGHEKGATIRRNRIRISKDYPSIKTAVHFRSDLLKPYGRNRCPYLRVYNGPYIVFFF